MVGRALLGCLLGLGLFAGCSPASDLGTPVGPPRPPRGDLHSDAAVVTPPAVDGGSGSPPVTGAPPNGGGCETRLDAQGCSCSPGDNRECYTGPAAHAGVGVCVRGHQGCSGGSEFGAFGACEGARLAGEELCENALDDDCDGVVDEDCPTIVELAVNLDGDCVTTQCPPQAPHPIGCSIIMHGNDGRGCVANASGSPVVYFQEGNLCGAGRVTGTLRCSSALSAPLSLANCVINKSQPIYPADRSGCPR